MFVPKKLIVPEVSRTRPEIARRVVLLPAPFAPSRPTASPSPTSILTSPTAGTDPELGLTPDSANTHSLLVPLHAHRRTPGRREPHLGLQRLPWGCLRQSSARDRAPRCDARQP